MSNVIYDTDSVIVLTKWAQKWLKFGWNIIVEGSPTEQIAAKLIKELDATLEEPCNYVESIIDERVRLISSVKRTKNGVEAVVSTGEAGNGVVDTTTSVVEDKVDVVREVVSRKVSQKLIKKQRSNFSAAVSKKAYNKFGERPMTPANILVTRKWLHKYLESEFKDLRTSDKNLAIDRALFLSFVPTKDFLRMRVLMETKGMENRMGKENFLGKIFQLRRGDSSL